LTVRIERAPFFKAVRERFFGGILKQSQVDGFNAILEAWEKRYPDGDLRWLAYDFATVQWETNHTMQPVREAYWLSEIWRRNNLRYWPWYGRGYVQLTWERNYQAMADILGVDLIGNPDMALEPTVAADIMFYGMEHGTFTGKKLGDFFPVGGGSRWAAARSIINGDDDVNHNGVADSIDIGNLGAAYFDVLQSTAVSVAQGKLDV